MKNEIEGYDFFPKKNSSGGGDRTPDLWIMIPLL